MEEKEIHEIPIPENVLYHKEIHANAKLLYCVIADICKQNGYCIEQNSYFAKLFGVSVTSISLWIKLLKDNKLIRYEIEERYIRAICLYKMSKAYLKGVLSQLKDNTTYYMREHIDNTHAVDDFNIITKEWIGKDGVKRGVDSIDYEE